MPDHVHVVLEATSPESELCRLMNSWKQQTGYAHARATGSKLWQNGYYDHVLRKDEDRLGIIAYLLSNPLRAGLVSDLRRYPFWGSGVWNRDQLLEAVQHLIAERTRRCTCPRTLKHALYENVRQRTGRATAICEQRAL